MTNPWGEGATPYESIGGDPVVRRLVDRFYDHMEASEQAIRDLHPADLASSRQKLYEFLTGWLGGPQFYTEKHGHPRLRMRHMPFAIDQPAVAAWLRCMDRAMDDCGISGELRAFLTARLTHTANFMQNRW